MDGPSLSACLRLDVIDSLPELSLELGGLPLGDGMRWQVVSQLISRCVQAINQTLPVKKPTIETHPTTCTVPGSRPQTNMAPSGFLQLFPFHGNLSYFTSLSARLSIFWYLSDPFNWGPDA